MRQAIFSFCQIAVLLLVVQPSVALNRQANGQTNGQEFVGAWQAAIESPGGMIEFGLEVEMAKDGLSAHLINGDERISVPSVIVEGDGSARRLKLQIKHYDSEIVIQRDEADEGLIGSWKKRRGKREWVEMKFSALPQIDSKSSSPERFLGRWSVDFESSEDSAVGIFEQAKGSNRVHGTFLTTTGDYRFLDGVVLKEEGTTASGAGGEEMRLSCFDGAHAFLFRGKLNESGNIEGKFWSSNTWQESWIARKDEAAKLPDAFGQTSVADKSKLQQLRFPDLDGNLKSLEDPQFAGEARIIYVFGSWCPNCHDAGEYFSQLNQKYESRGLSILGLAFELTGDFDRDAEQVRKYLKRHGSSYPVLIAGLADKAQASKALPLLDRVRSYPTTIFVDRDGQIRAVHTGFTGPATGVEFKLLREKFEALIESMLEDPLP